MLRIVLTGAESSGKSTLTKFLAAHFSWPYALEYARMYLEENSPTYDYTIVHKIASQHICHQQQQVPVHEPIGIYDTDLLNFTIWCEVAFGRCEPWLKDAAEAESDHVYLLCRPDIPWEEDPLREYPHEREELFEKHLAAVLASGREYVIVEGEGNDRLINAISAVKHLLLRYNDLDPT